MLLGFHLFKRDCSFSHNCEVSDQVACLHCSVLFDCCRFDLKNTTRRLDLEKYKQYMYNCNIRYYLSGLIILMPIQTH